MRSSKWLRALGLFWMVIACAPPGPAALEIYLRTDLSAAERADARFVVRIARVGAAEDALPPIELGAATLAMDDLASAGGALLGRFPELPVDRYQVSLDLAHGTAASERVDFAAVDFRGEGAQQVVFLVLRSGGSGSCDATTPCPEAPCASTECIGGSCFELRSPDWSASCECDEAADCPAATGCGAARCEDHTCTSVPDDSRCGATETCRTDFTCDTVTCRGRNAGDICRGASSACDAPERCVAGSTACPPDASLELGAGCIDDDSMLPGFCSASGGMGLVCDPGCEAGRPCQLGCTTGVQVCAPSPMCDTSAGGTVSDGTPCGAAQLCREAASCQSGTCTLGAATVDVVCGADPAPDCVAAPRCNAAGSCEPSPAAAGTPCTVVGPTGMVAVATVCYGFFCNATGMCAQSPILADSRCDSAPSDECDRWTCRPERSSSRWGCNPEPSDELCLRDFCDYDTHCEFTNTMDRGPFYDCQDWGEPRCRRTDGTSTSCDFSEPTCDQALCFNTVLDTPETDVDCGGPYCPACGPGQICLGDQDCISGTCSSGACL